MVKVRGKSEVRAYMAALPAQITSVLRGAARAGGKIIADEAKARVISQEVADDIVIRSRMDDGRIVVTITVKKGFSWSIGLWLEQGTDAHFITVDDRQRGGRGIRRINQQVREAGGDGSLVIGGQFVGKTVWHPGAQPHPFLRPALDVKEGEAIRAAQSYINARIAKGRIIGRREDDHDDRG